MAGGISGPSGLRTLASLTDRTSRTPAILRRLLAGMASGDGETAILVGVLALSMLVEAHATGAFPGVEGHGAAARGGRDGRIITVDNLNDSGKGSLRACVTQKGPRNCVFRIAGVIVLRQSLLVDGADRAFLSIFGQTAPGMGITLTVDPQSKSFMQTPLIVRRTHDIVIQNLRLRSQAPPTTGNVDAITVEASRDVVIDHVSGSWATDENVNTQGPATDITISHSIFAEGLRVHSKCALLGSHGTGPQNISFWRNLCISNNDRNPDMNFFAKSCIDIVDNLFYNARSEWAEIFSQKEGGTPVSIVGNYFKAGPSTLQTTYAIRFNPVQSIANPSFFQKDNEIWSPSNKTLLLVAPDTAAFAAEAPECIPSVDSYGNAETTYSAIVAGAGAFPRDEVDSRLIGEVGVIGVPGTGSLRKTAGPISLINPASPYIDVDRDGMADAVEDQFGAEVGVRDGWHNRDAAGYASFDRFMQWLLQQRMSGRFVE